MHPKLGHSVLKSIIDIKFIQDIYSDKVSTVMQFSMRPQEK